MSSLSAKTLNTFNQLQIQNKEATVVSINYVNHLKSVLHNKFHFLQTITVKRLSKRRQER